MQRGLYVTPCGIALTVLLRICRSCRGANGAGECHGGGGARKTLDTLKEPRRVTHGAMASERVGWGAQILLKLAAVLPRELGLHCFRYCGVVV